MASLRTKARTIPLWVPDGLENQPPFLPVWPHSYGVVGYRRQRWWETVAVATIINVSPRYRFLARVFHAHDWSRRPRPRGRLFPLGRLAHVPGVPVAVVAPVVEGDDVAALAAEVLRAELQAQGAEPELGGFGQRVDVNGRFWVRPGGFLAAAGGGGGESMQEAPATESPTHVGIR